jgi:hypothetical protein
MRDLPKTAKAVLETLHLWNTLLKKGVNENWRIRRLMV